jgi:2-polyprenyl-3-methyl-5-hydroxy-6-metoxy-1,4-benzoquinol methylase
MSVQFATLAKACRVCHSTGLKDVLSLGNQYVSDFVSSDGKSPEVPLRLARCQKCGLVQLRHTFSRDKLYRQYWYKSGISGTMQKALADLVSETCSIAKPQAGDLVLDVGCNDGTLLRSYPKTGLFLTGFEPAKNLVADAKKGSDWIFSDFFNAKAFTEKFGQRKAKIITSVAMFYDLEDPNSFVSDIAKILAPDGVWTVQQNYLATMLEQNGFDNIGHEHLEYYSLGTMKNLVENHGLKIFDVETNNVNGGSFRTFISHKGKYPVKDSVARLERHEARLGLDKESTYNTFAKNIQIIGTRLHDFIVAETRRGKSVYVYGASNRGNTILQFCRLDHSLVRKAADANPEKWGRKTAGSLIPIVSKEEARKDQPDYFLVLPHHFFEEIRRDELHYLNSGGKFIVPLPTLRVVSEEGEATPESLVLS